MRSILLFLASALISFQGLAEPIKNNFSHQVWNNLLQKHVSETGVVDYAGFMKDRLELKKYLDALGKTKPGNDWTKNEQMAFWINAYNAFTVDLILERGIPSSIMKINGGKAWDMAFITIGGDVFSLNNIEHDILRAKFKDPRIHFAVNCASISCPRLLNKAFEAETLESQLEAMTKSFINNKYKNKIGETGIIISKLFTWYEDDFTKNGTVIDFLNQYVSITIAPDAKIMYMEYNWELNNK